MSAGDRSTGARPPIMSAWLLRLALHRDDRECALSDLDEEFDTRAARDGVRAARRWYRSQAIRSVWPAIVRRTALRADASSASPRDPAAALAVEMTWVWRGLRARGWRAAVVSLLFGVALAANAIVFAAADAFVFHTLPYAQPDRLVIVEKTGRMTSDYLWPQAVRGWRAHTDLFAGMHAHVPGDSAYLTDQGVTESVRSERITPGLLELLGVLPRWGRPFTQADLDPAIKPVIVAELLARRVFGAPELAVGQTFFTGSETLTVIGVMPASFRFPTARQEFWRPLDLETRPNDDSVRDIARLAEGQTLSTALTAFAARSTAVEQLVTRRLAKDHMQLRPMAAVRGNAGARSVFLVLVGAAACVLLIACANVASLEVAAVSRRVRDHAIQAALGASRASLVRVTLVEGAILLLASAAVATALTAWGLTVLDNQLTVAMRDALTNPLDVDLRAMSFMIAAGAVTWLLTSIPAIRRVSRLAIVDGLRDDPRTMPVTRAAARSRNLLMAGQIALTTLLLVGALLYLRTYAAKVGLDKGFDDSNVVTIAVTAAPDAALDGRQLEDQVFERLRATPGVRAVSRTDSLPPDTWGGVTARLTIDDREPTPERVKMHIAGVDPSYFGLMGIAIIEGRGLDTQSPIADVVIDERFARSYWPSGSPLGARFRLQSAENFGVSEFHVVGVSRQLRVDQLLTATREQVFVAYMRPTPKYYSLTFVARLHDPSLLGGLDDVVRAVSPRLIVRTDTVAARYARLEANTRLVAAVTTGFGAIALLVAITGIYAVMAYLVGGRSREIAIRMALGADRNGVRRLVLSASMGYVFAGLIAGSLAAFGAASILRAELFGVSPQDPSTYAGVAALIVVTALVASWWPARRATRVDPALALRQP